jgi:magnesium transporter
MPLDLIPKHYQDEVFDLLNHNQYSQFEDYHDFQLLILRHIEVIQGQKMTFPISAFLMQDENVYRFDKATSDLIPIEKGFEGLVRTLEHFYSANQRVIEQFFTQLETLEDQLFKRNPPHYFMDMWFDLKRELTKLKNYYFRNSMVYREFYRSKQEALAAVSDDIKEEFKDVEENIHFQISNIDTLISRLEGLYSYYESIKADRLNKTLLTLTVISGIFLPLNLIVGFFGMNTQGLFFTSDPEGTQKVLVVLLGVLGVCVLGFKVLQLMDRYFLRYILGRYDFYQNWATQIDDLSSRFRGK